MAVEKSDVLLRRIVSGNHHVYYNAVIICARSSSSALSANDIVLTHRIGTFIKAKDRDVMALSLLSLLLLLRTRCRADVL